MTDSRQCNITLPTDLIAEIKAEAYRLTGHQRRGFSELVSICARYGWAAYQRGELSVERKPKVITYQIVAKEDTQC